MAQRDRGADASVELDIDTSDMKPRFEPPPEPDLPLILEEQRAPPKLPPVTPAASAEPRDFSNPDLVRPPPRVLQPPRRGARELAQASIASFQGATRMWIAIGVAAFLVVVVLVYVYAAGSSAGPSDIEAAEAAGQMYQVTDHSLAEAFARNASAATRTYAGHRMRIVGRFSKLRIDYGGANALQLIGNGAWSIDAVLRPEVWKSLATPSGGQRVSVECVVRGRTDEYVRADDCTLE
jgi:tRNA_anti-like